MNEEQSNLFGKLLRPRVYGQQYQDAQNKDELLYALGRAFAWSATCLMKSYAPPQPHFAKLLFAKWFKPQSYERYLSINRELFARCLGLCNRHLRIYFTRRLSPEVADYLALQIPVYAVHHLSTKCRFETNETKRIFERTKDVVFGSFDDEFPDDAGERDGKELRQIFDAIGEHNPSPKQIAEVVHTLMTNDPTAITEPWHFADRWEELGLSIK